MKKLFVVFAFILLVLMVGCQKEKSDPVTHVDNTKPIQDEPVSKDGVINNLMNIGINQGFVVCCKDATLFTIENSDNLIYKIDSEGKISEAFNGVKASQLLTTDHALYLTYNIPQKDFPYGLFKFDPKGLARNLIYSNDRQQIFAVYADDDWVYFCTYNLIVSKTDSPPAGEEPRMYSFYTLYKVGVDGGEPQEVLNYIYNLHLPYISDGWIYYSTVQPDWVVEQEKLGEREKGLYKIKLDATEKSKLLDTVPFRPIVKEGDWLYYSEGAVYRLKIDGSEQVKISGDSAAGVNVKDNWVYYTSFADEISLYKMDWEGDNKQKLSQQKRVQDISIIDDWVYFSVYEDRSGWSLYRVKTDGSKEEKIERYDLKTVLKGLDSPVANEELVALFFNYLIKDNSHELRLMPDFDSAKKPDWDGLTRFVFMMCDQVESDEEGTYTLTKKAFEETVKRFFAGEFDYTHHNSTYLRLAGDVYTPTGWDFHGATYYRLYKLEKIKDDTYRAAFDGFSFHELDSFDDPSSENMKALKDYAGEGKESARWFDLILEVLQKNNYEEILKKDQQIEITFKLSDDPVYAFKYLSSKRNYIN